MGSIKDFSIRKTMIKHYPDIVVKGGIDFDKDGAIGDNEKLIDEDENGKFDEAEYWNFFQDYKNLISKKVTQEVDVVKIVAKNGVEGECLGEASCVVSCMEVLGAMKDKSNIPTFLKTLDDYNLEVRRASVRALGNAGDKSVLGMLLDKAKNDESPKVRAAAVTALSKLYDKSDNSTEGIITDIRLILSDDKTGLVKSACTLALSRIGNETAIPELKVALTEKNDTVRSNAAKALGVVGNSSVIPDLITALRDTVVKVRRNAAEALGKIGDASAKSALEEAVKDLDPGVSQSAAAALAKVNEKISQEEAKKAEEAKKLAEQKKADDAKKAAEAKPKGGCGCEFVY